ncbi:MAG: HAMP domain-containing sensor histidine kinase, partial [Candidatus Omnitrophota bacterium]|nr:HAMP domain-containing sensor histidine kinase [Candidatus Omnitrophota bacterium]
ATALDKALLYEMLQITNKKLAESNEALKMLDTAKSEFISIASHQLRAPLTVIKGYVSMTLEGSFGKVTEKTKGALLKVAVSAEQLIKLIGDMLNLSRMESGKIQYRFVEADRVAVAKGVIDEYQPEAKKRGLEILFDNKLPGEFLMKFDPDKIREVVINLVHNAIKYTPKGKITVELSQHDGVNDRVRLAVCDEGMGIKPGDISRLFTKFVRTDQAQISDPNGMGIGLYFVKRVAEDHGGRVWAESEGIGNASTFAGVLPPPAVVRPTKE